MDDIIDASSSFELKKDRDFDNGGFIYFISFTLELNDKEFTGKYKDPDELRKRAIEFYDRYTKRLIYSLSVDFDEQLVLVSDSAFLSKDDQETINKIITDKNLIKLKKLNELKADRLISVGEIISCEYIENKYLWNVSKEHVSENFKSESEKITKIIGKMFKQMLE